MSAHSGGAMGRTPAGETRNRVFAFVRTRLLAGQPPTVREVQEGVRFPGGRDGAPAPGATGCPGPPGGRPPQGARGTGCRCRPPRSLPCSCRCSAACRPARSTRRLKIPTATCRWTPGARPMTCSPLRVRGESMTGVGILPGDLVIVRRQPIASSGDVVVALVGGRRHGQDLQAARPEGRATPGESGVRAACPGRRHGRPARKGD